MATIDSNDRHEIYLAKLTSHLLNSKVYPTLAEAYKAARLILLDAESIGSVRQMRRIQDAIGKEVTPILQQAYAKMTVGLTEMAVYEAGFAAQLYGREMGESLKVPAKARIERYIQQSSMTLTSGQRVTTGTWANFVTDAVNANARQYDAVVVRGYQQGQTIGQMTTEIRNSTNGLMRNQAEALARTGQSHYANNAREAMAEANADVIKVRVFTATFDDRTTLGCRSFNGQSWPMGDDTYPRLPRHFGCRSTYVFGQSQEQVLSGRRTAKGGKSEEGDMDPGLISANRTQSQWLKDQPEWFQDRALGPTRAKLLREGGADMSSFVDMTGDPISLDRLRELDAEIFRKAGI